MIVLSVILMPAGQTSVQHLVMLHRPRPCRSRSTAHRSIPMCPPKSNATIASQVRITLKTSAT
jgi:hypothetical protein